MVETINTAMSIFLNIFFPSLNVSQSSVNHLSITGWLSGRRRTIYVPYYRKLTLHENKVFLNERKLIEIDF